MATSAPPSHFSCRRCRCCQQQQFERVERSCCDAKLVSTSSANLCRKSKEKQRNCSKENRSAPVLFANEKERKSERKQVRQATNGDGDDDDVGRRFRFFFRRRCWRFRCLDLLSFSLFSLRERKKQHSASFFTLRFSLKASTAW